MISHEQFVEKLVEHIRSEYDTQAAAAEAWGMKQQQLSNIIRGRAVAPEWLAEKIGYRRVKTVTVAFVEA